MILQVGVPEGILEDLTISREAPKTDSFSFQNFKAVLSYDFQKPWWVVQNQIPPGI
jgi:hypothetical protein